MAKNGVGKGGGRQGAKVIAPAAAIVPRQPARPVRVGFFLVPNFTMMAFTSAIEPLRLANQVTERPLYVWRLFSSDGGAVAASNGVEVRVDEPFAQARDLSAAILCAGNGVQNLDHRDVMAVLRRLSSFGTSLGAVCTGTYVLAKAGLLEGYQSTIHWENQASLTAEFPQLDITSELFEIDRNRFTCAGGTAAADMMLSIIARDHGQTLATAVTDQLIHHRIREASERQRMDLRTRLGVAHPRLLAVVARMEETIETPLSCTELASEAGVSPRQLERLFAKYLGHSPTRHYLTVRLDRARFLLQQTSQPILSVAMACGFVSASHFSKSYNEHFGHTPSTERKVGTRDVTTGSGKRMAQPS
jgi:AraC family transcriptional regulator, glycine betaine-responsive activator